MSGIPSPGVRLASAWLCRTFGRGRVLIGGRALPFSGGVAYHFRASHPKDSPALRVEVVVNDDGTVDGPRRIGSNERRRAAVAVRHAEGRWGARR